jgi:hypothetical protein
MAKRIGTTKDIIDWDSIIASITPRTGAYNSPLGVKERAEKELGTEDVVAYKNYLDIFKTWEAAGYDLKNIEWWDYYARPHTYGVYDQSVLDAFEKIVGFKCRTNFISEIMPGQCVPYHWDIEDREEQWLAEGADLVRYVCFIQTPTTGHIFIDHEDCFYNIPQHEIYEWNHYKDYHAGTNVGMEPYYLFHYLADRSL